MVCGCLLCATSVFSHTFLSGNNVEIRFNRADCREVCMIKCLVPNFMPSKMPIEMPSTKIALLLPRKILTRTTKINAEFYAELNNAYAE